MPLSRFGRRHKHTFGKKKEKWDGNFRSPPKPDSYENKTHNTRKTWHEPCATQYMIIYHSGEARKHVWLRDQGRCAECGKQCTRRGWDLDHIKPLMEQKGKSEKELDWSYYWLDNMQTLCKPCHKEKTKQDRKNNAGVTK